MQDVLRTFPKLLKPMRLRALVLVCAPITANVEVSAATVSRSVLPTWAVVWRNNGQSEQHRFGTASLRSCHKKEARFVSDFAMAVSYTCELSFRARITSAHRVDDHVQTERSN